MSRKYVGQINSKNFVYPNQNLAEYDVEIIHDINDNCVSGTITDITVSSSSSTGITITHNGTFLTNGAQPFITTFANPLYTLQYLSVHCQVPNQTYMNTWKLVDTLSATTSTPLTYTGNTITGNVITILPSMFGLSVFTSGTYYFEFRFIGQNCISKVCSSIDITIVAATPTPTPTMTPTNTPTNTPGLTPTPGLSPTPSATPSGVGDKSLQIYGRDVAGTRSTLTLFYSVNGGLNIDVPGYTGDQLPSSCTFLYTITGLTTSDNITIGTSTNCVMTGNGSSSSCPSSGGSFVDYTYVIDAPTTQQVAITINSDIIP
jgi:hypothetical protein